MGKFKIVAHEVTGVNGKSFLKGEIVDEKQLISGAIDFLKSTAAIEEVIVEEMHEEKKAKSK